MRDAQNVAELLVKACKRPTRRRPRSIHGAAIEADILAVADLWLEELTRLQADVDAVRRVGLWLASTSPNRGPVKIGWRCLARQGATDMSTSLFAALELDSVDRALLTAPGDILSELIDGPAQDIDNYADGADAIEHFLALMRGPAPSHFLITVR